MTDRLRAARDGLASYVRAARARAVVLVVGVVALAVVALAGSALATLFGLTTHEYVSGILPTLVGVVAGLPLALWLIRAGEEVSGQRENKAAEARRRLVIAAIREELQEALDELRGERGVRPRPFPFPFLKTEAWRALADGGDLRWIDDPELIGRLARAYHRIESTTILEREIFGFYNDPVRRSVTLPPGAYQPLEWLTAAVLQQDEHTIAAIDHALDGIARALGE